MVSYNHLSNGNSLSSEVSRSVDNFEIQSLASVEDEGLHVTSPEDKANLDDTPSLDDVSSKGSIDANDNLQDLQTIFKAAGSLTLKEREEVVFERKKNADLLAFIQSIGLSIHDVNLYVQDIIVPEICTNPASNLRGEKQSDTDMVQANLVPERESHLPAPVRALGAATSGGVCHFPPFPKGLASGASPTISKVAPDSLPKADLEDGELGAVPSGPKSWSSLVANNNGVAHKLDLSFFPPSCENGHVFIKPPPEILSKGNSLWSSSLVGYFLHSKLPFKVVEPAAFRLWGNYGLQKVFLHTNGYYILKFKSAADRDNVLALGPWYISNRQIVLQHWKEGSDFQKDTCTKTPIWVKFHHIPLSYWTIEGLSYLASGIGKPLFSDKATSLLEPMNFARICIEVDFNFHYPDTISVAVQDVDCDDISFLDVKVEYQNRPPSCPDCKTFGHSKLKCPKANYQWVPKAKADIPPIRSSQNHVSSNLVSAPSHDVSDTDGWTAPKGLHSSKDRSTVVPPATLSNSFNLLAPDSSVDCSDNDLTPAPNPLVSKLKIIDEKEGRDQKNKAPADISTHASKVRKKADGRRSPKS